MYVKLKIILFSKYETNGFWAIIFVIYGLTNVTCWEIEKLLENLVGRRDDKN